LNNPALTQKRYRPDPFLGGDNLMFRTRDLGRWTADGRLEPGAGGSPGQGAWAF